MTRSDPEQRIITYQEGSDQCKWQITWRVTQCMYTYIQCWTLNGHSHQSVTLTYEDWFGDVLEANLLPSGMTAGTVLPVDLKNIYKNTSRETCPRHRNRYLLCPLMRQWHVMGIVAVSQHVIVSYGILWYVCLHFYCLQDIMYGIGRIEFAFERGFF
jgi:hypothetical protein